MPHWRCFGLFFSLPHSSTLASGEWSQELFFFFRPLQFIAEKHSLHMIFRPQISTSGPFLPVHITAVCSRKRQNRFPSICKGKITCLLEERKSTSRVLFAIKTLHACARVQGRSCFSSQTPVHIDLHCCGQIVPH